MMGLGRLGKLGAVGRAIASWNPARYLFGASEKGGLWDFTTLASLYQDSAFTTPCTAVGDPIGGVLDTSGNGAHLTQATPTKRLTLGRMPAGGVRNNLVNTDVLSTQNVTINASQCVLSFTGTGTITKSGTATGALVGTGASNRVSETFTPTAGTLTLTVTGSVTLAQLELGSTATPYQKVAQAYDVTEEGQASIWAAYADGVDDAMATSSINFSGTDKMTVWAGVRNVAPNTSSYLIAELSANSASNSGSFGIISSWDVFGDYGMMRKASLSQSGTSSPVYPTPNNSIISGQLDFQGVTDATEAPTFRINGVAVARGVRNPDSGAGNFGNYPIYIASRGGTSLPFKGFLSLLAIRGAASTAEEIAAMERYMAARTPGVSLP